MNNFIARKSQWALSVLLVGGINMPANAALLDRGNGMLYDTVLNVTWLQDANYAKTSGYDDDGLMSLTEAKTWTENLTFGGATNWRLASNSPINGVDFVFSSDFYSGSADQGYNVVSPNAELSYMFYVNLGLHGRYNTNGTPRSDNGVFGNGNLFELDAGGNVVGGADAGLIKNLQNRAYWLNTNEGPASNWIFMPYDGWQGVYSNENQLYAWAVHDGDVAAVPLPGAVWLFGAGLAGLLARGKR
ncbi:PEP-CTERM sorting domain-containing protein [Methylomonas fluvii]|uniref:PEP-CTERM sorting domain-containing protein n=1 Tax=Methylomonas fluvii TaxID=1854564 RepID=A0ABR9D8B8_9GAMM|nr:PEP-CTERM sorting domain-containing protein [Methylomonas fluvii]MBD9359185.1 PEP-CTERM sorting domain-containing protein [Methylomonas fluvii]